ncbi:hypothetical protein [Methanobrevibacter sp.]|uniref:hypothetical protein n=1 Tax=Methanobrevibacter sp. TaxID=66852 RepID=UPI00386407FA
MKKIFPILLIFVFILSVGVVFADNCTDIYVSNEGSDSLGDGSLDNPYQTLNYTIEKSANNSNIYLKKGVYNSTGYVISNKSLSITGLDEVVIDGCGGKNSQLMFKVNNGSSLSLNNIKLLNGYANKSGTLSPIINEGELFINNCHFNNFTTVNGAIYNKNNLYLNDATTSDLQIDWHDVYGDVGNIGFLIWIGNELRNPPRGELVTNIGNCFINNSNITSTIYNALNMTVNNSSIIYFVSNKKFLDKPNYSVFDNSKIYTLRLANCTSIVLNNSYVYREYGHEISSCNFFIQNSVFSLNYNEKDPNTYYLNFGESNVTAIGSIFNDHLEFGKGNVNISYSAIYDKISCDYDGIYDFNYNWWGDNKGPKVNNDYVLEYSKVYADKWIVMMFNQLGNSTFSVDLTKYTSGGNVYNLSDSSKLPSLFVKFEAESGEFLNSTGYLVNSTFSSDFIINNPNSMIYATVDNQILRFVIGEGNSDYKIYISDSWGNDYFNDGSFENPYKTLKQAVSKAFSGNTIYVMSGYYTLGWNSNIQISKNLTVSGIGNVTFARPNDRSIFIVDSKGCLSIENINFTVATSDNYFNSLIELSSGNLNVKSCNFYDIASQAVIMAKNNEYINLDNVSFNNIRGPAVLGFASNLFVKNSRFSNGSIMHVAIKYFGQENNGDNPATYLDFYITLSATITVVNTTFSDNTAGAIGYYTNSINYDFWNLNSNRYWYKNLKTYIYNSTFVNNGWDKQESHNILGIGLAIGNCSYHEYGFGLIENSTFINNTGHMMYASEINNSRFINNSASPRVSTFDGYFYRPLYYYPDSLIKSTLINNSYFYGNTYLSKKYTEMIIDANFVYSSVFIKNRAAYGGALSNCSEVHYCVFINNSATYEGNDLFLYAGDLNCSSNWWGDNQKPGLSKVYVFLGDLIIDDWIIMSITNEGNLIKASLDNLVDNNKNIYQLNHSLPSRYVEFSTDGGSLTPKSAFLVNNTAYTKVIRNTTKDFDVFAKIDNQIISLTLYNNSTLIVVENLTYYGKNNRFNMTLININGHKISKQLLNVVIRNSTDVVEIFALTTDDFGFASIDFNYPIGNYMVDIDYYGNGYFEKTHSQASIKVSSISTVLISHNYTYYGKNNRFYALLTDKYGNYLANQTIVLKIYDSKNRLISTDEVKTSSNGRADVLLSLDSGSYKLIWDYLGNEWYTKSNSKSFINVKPINTTIEIQNKTLYGRGNDYIITFKDSYENAISDEIITLKISNATDSNQFRLKTQKGLASININLVPGVYNLEASFAGDDIYGASKAEAILKIEPVFVTLDYSSRLSIPENGIFTVILKDMYGKKVSGELVTLDLIYKTFSKKYTTISDANGEANFKVDVDENTYFALIEYNGSTWFRGASGASTVTVSHDVILNNVYLNGSDFTAYYGENKFYTILFNDSNAYSLEGKNISVIISSGEWSKAFDVESDVFGKVRLQITLNPGMYNISYKYENRYYNLHAEGVSSISIFDMPTTLIASDLIVKKDDLRNFEVKLVNKNGVSLSNLPVTINIDGKSTKVNTNNLGIAKLLVDLDLGYHNVTCLFDDENFIKSSCNATILVVDDSKTITSLESSSLHVNESNLFNFTVILSDALENPIKSSQVILNISDDEGNFVDSLETYTNNNGEAVFYLNLTYGVYQVKSYYKGSEIYFESFNTNYIYVAPLENVTETILLSNDCEIVNGQDNYYFVILKTADDNFVCNATIEFIVKGHNYFALTDGAGKAVLNVSFAPGAYEVKAKYAGANNLTKAQITNYVRVSGELLYLISYDVVKYYNNGTHYYVALFDASGEPLVNKTISFIIGNDTFNRTTDFDGFACFEIWFNPGEYVIEAIYQGEYPDEYARVINNITVLTTLLSENITKYYDGNTILSASFSDFNGNALKDYYVIFNIGGVNYKVKTDKYGFSSFDINLKSGNYNLTVYNTLTGQIEVYKVNISSTLTTSNLVKYYKGSEKFKATFKDKNGKLLKNTKVKFTVNGKTYNIKTNSNGVASLAVNLKPGKYTITTLNIKTGQKNTNKITVKTTIITKNIKVKVGKKINFQAKIHKSNGKIAKKVTVKFKINKKTYKIKTNAKGIAKLNIKLKKGTYTIKTTYNGFTVNNKVRVVK